MRYWIGWLCILVGMPLWAAEVPATRPASTQPMALSVPVEKDGVSVSVGIWQSPVPADTQPELVVRFTNIGKSYKNLYDVGAYWNWTIHFTNTDPHAAAPGPWRLRMNSIPMRAKLEHRQIKPGESTEILVNLNDPPFTFEYVYDGDEDRPIHPLRFLNPGHYQVTAKVSLPAFPIGNDKHFWLGPVTSKPVELIIANHPPRTVTKEQLAAYDAAIARVTDKLDRHGLWTNGISPRIDLPKDATVEEVIDAGINETSLGSKNYRVLRIERFERDNVPERVAGHAALLRVGAGYKVVILFPIAQHGWWSRFYDANVVLPATCPGASGVAR